MDYSMDRLCALASVLKASESSGLENYTPSLISALVVELFDMD